MGRAIALNLAASGVAVVVTDKQATGVLNRRQQVVGVTDESWGGVGSLVEESGPRVALTVSPGPDACEDCLVPKDVFRGIAANQLGIEGDLIDITYPVDLPGYSGGSH